MSSNQKIPYLNSATYLNNNSKLIKFSFLPTVIIFIIILICSGLIRVYRNKIVIYSRIVGLFLFFIVCILSLMFNIAVINMPGVNDTNKSITKINLIVLSILFIVTLLYLLLSHTFGCF